MMVDEKTLLTRITGQPRDPSGRQADHARGRRLAVEKHVLGSARGRRFSPETILEGYPWLEPQDIRRRCLANYARRLESVTKSGSRPPSCWKATP